MFKCLDVIMAGIPAKRFSRMGVLVDQPGEVKQNGPVNWDFQWWVFSLVLTRLLSLLFSR